MSLRLYRYFAKAGMPRRVPSLSDNELKETNTSVKNLQEKNANGRSPGRPIRYNDYSPEERASIGKYTAENGIVCAVRHFSRPSTASSDSMPERTYQPSKLLPSVNNHTALQHVHKHQVHGCMCLGRAWSAANLKSTNTFVHASFGQSAKYIFPPNFPAIRQYYNVHRRNKHSIQCH